MPDPSPAAAPASLLKMLEESEADLAAGRVVPSSVIEEEFRESIARLEARLAQESDPTQERR